MLPKVRSSIHDDYSRIYEYSSLITINLYEFTKVPSGLDRIGGQDSYRTAYLQAILKPECGMWLESVPI